VRLAAALVVSIVAAGTARADLDNQLDTVILRPLARAYSRSVAKSLPIPAASAGITFVFNPATSAFERTTEIAGQLFLEPARPIGKGHLDVNVTYQWVHIDTFDGHDLGNLSDVRTPILVPGPKGMDRTTVPHLDLSLTSHEMTTSITYGVTTDLEVNLTLPFLETHLGTSGALHDLDQRTVQPTHVDDAVIGIGDIFLRGKYRFLHGRLGDVAAGLVLRLPSGSEGNFQGTGTFEMSPYLYASTPSIEAAPGMRLQAHVNAGLDLVPQDSSLGEGRYGVGADCMLAERMTLSLAFLGREPFSRLAPAGSFDVARAGGGEAPIFGLAPGHPSYYDLAVGLRVDLWGDTVFGLANVIVPLNPDAGMRSNVIPLIGIEATF
jgi:hypothetical protein